MTEECRHAFLVTLFNRSLDHKLSAARELASELIAEATAKRIIAIPDVSVVVMLAMRLLLKRQRRVGFDTQVAGALTRVLDDDELLVDYPCAGEWLGNFIARAVADRALDMATVEQWRQQLSGTVRNMRR